MRAPGEQGTSHFGLDNVDLEQPTSDSIEFFYFRLEPGGILLCDDYGHATCPGATAAADSFLATRPEKMISLGTGGGFLIKGLTCAEEADLTNGLASSATWLTWQLVRGRKSSCGETLERLRV